MLLRGANAVGYTSYPDNVIVEFVREAHAQGIDIFRIFDSLNSIDNMRVSIDAVLETGARVRAGHLLHGRHPRSRPAEIFAEILRRHGQAARKAGRAFSGHQGHGRAVQALRRAFELVKALREEIGIPDPLPHARYQRRQRRLGPESRPTPAWTWPTPPSPP